MKLKALSASIGVDEGEYIELMRLFIDTSISEIERLRQSLEVGDLSKAAGMAHSLKGAAVNLNLSELAAQGESLESAIKNRCLSDIENIAGNMLGGIKKLAGYL